MDYKVNNVETSPIPVMRSTRVDEKRVLTSGNAGKVLPIMHIPLLREDSVQSGRVRLSFEMMETAEKLMNGINVQVNAHFVPFLAFERFNGMDQLNRSYRGEPDKEGGTVTPFFDVLLPTALTASGKPEIHQTLGIHHRNDAQINTSVIEAYNTVVNFRRKMRSKSLTLRTPRNHTLAEAFWHHTNMKHIVPDFDQAMIDGEVALNVVNSAMPVRGIGVKDVGLTGSSTWEPHTHVYEADGNVRSGDYKRIGDTRGGDSIFVARDGVSEFPAVFAEMQENGITVSLSNIELAKKTRAFAQLRNQYQGHDDDYIVDLLMSGIRVPEQALQQPILMAQKNTLFGYSQRYATDGSSLDKSVTTGATFVDLNLRLPPMNTGGIILITAEITPEQLFERQKDHFLHATSVDQLPRYDRDALDPEKVAIVPNEHVDVDHTDPDGTFGYAPLNYQWMRKAPNIGGKYYRPDVDATFDEDRQKIWAVETVDPTLTEDFYLCTQMHQKVFADTESDAFEIMASGRFDIVGNTVFGAALREATDDYDRVLADVDHTRIDKE